MTKLDELKRHLKPERAYRRADLARWEFQLGNRKFAFRLKPRFPKSLTKEFLLVDLVNNVDQLAEAKDEVLKRVAERAAKSDQKRLRHVGQEGRDQRPHRQVFQADEGD